MVELDRAFLSTAALGWWEGWDMMGMAIATDVGIVPVILGVLVAS